MNECDYINCNEPGIHSLSSEETQELNIREERVIGSLCVNHYRNKFELFHLNSKKKCEDPRNIHLKKTAGHFQIDLPFYNDTIKYVKDMKITPGKSLCKKCKEFLSNIILENKSSEVHEPLESDESMGSVLINHHHCHHPLDLEHFQIPL